MSSRLLAQACTSINNANALNRRSVLIRNVNNMVLRFLTLMQKHNYVDNITVIRDKRVNKVLVQLNGRLNRCAAISPNYDLKMDKIEKVRESVLPARQFGVLVLSCGQGMWEHGRCVGKTGGKVLGYFF